MTLPKNDLQPDATYTYPSRKAYLDDTKSTLGDMKLSDPTKSGKDYGITDPEKTKTVVVASG